MIPRERIVEKLRLAREERDRLIAQMNATNGYIQALEETLSMMDEPEAAPAQTVDNT